MPRVVLVRDPRFPIGGFETWVETLAALLPARSIEVTLLSPRSDDPAAEILSGLGERAVRGEHGVVFTGGYEYLNVVSINLIGSPWVPIPVLHGRDPGAVEWFAVGPPPKIVVPAVDLAAPLQAALEERVGRLRARGRIVVIPHGVPVPAAPKRKPSLPLDVIVVSRFEDDAKRASDYVRIVDAAKDLPLRFTFVGDGSALPAMREALGDRVRFTGALSRTQVYEELLNADVLLSASSSEAFGLSIAEALACGCHVIAADAGAAVREMLGGNVVPVGDIDAFVRELENWLRAPVPVLGAGDSRGFTTDEAMADAYAALVRDIRSRPNRNWRPTLHRTPADALPKTLTERAANWLRALREVLS
jgi:glycosyltransferase involved in cell wall biosynthesis